MTSALADLAPLLPGYLARQRWFPAKGRPVASVALEGTPLLADGPLLLDLCVLRVQFDDAGGDQHYQLLVARREDPRVEATHVIGQVGSHTAYDALWDPEATTWLIGAIGGDTRVGDLAFVPEPGADIPVGVPGLPLGVEQSNTSVRYGDTSIFKLFRQVSAGVSPDVELHRALRSVGSDQVAALQGAVEGRLGGEAATLGMLQDFAAGAQEGWALALDHVRADLSGELGDFTDEAARLGEAVAAVHAQLARALGTGSRSGDELAAALTARLDEAVRDVPALEPFTTGIRAAYGELAGEIRTHRVHGDLHLGQTLRTPRGWLLIDFEGEPSTPLAERVRMDSPLRDVAGMLRSFDYAAYHQVALEGRAEHLDAAAAWASRTRDAFSAGYAAAAGADPRAELTVLRAFELDKAVYEAVYETRSRPSWAVIPLASIARLVGAGTSA